ncbi:hypothetical protein NLB33_04160 [Mycolicibacterium smegmatis]|uniref:hypothetical protein n=1 Tax=Mycolicibacterium smegmatis TaxID=1772 RepID=UPI0020A3B32F|nr:hypothetical protein [Mycolicibacterium smegmatis]MCP2622046.1 hypothetical protein [Mycolicibacterium smegmatis]
MTTTTSPLTVPVGVARDSKELTVDLRQAHGVLIMGVAGSGKTHLLRRMLGALESHPGVRLFHAEGIAAARAEMERRLQDPSLVAGPVVLALDPGHTPATANAVRDIAVKGRAVDVHLLVSTQLVLGSTAGVLSQMSTRIVVGPSSAQFAHAFSEPEWEQVKAAAAGEHFSGVLVDADGELTPFAALPRETR